jgi:hypothetical protein
VRPNTRHLSIMTPSGQTQTGSWLIADFRNLTLSLRTNDTTSAYTVLLSNAHGLTSAIPANSWSMTTVLVAQGQFEIEAGSRWLKVELSSSTVTIELNGTQA